MLYKEKKIFSFTYVWTHLYMSYLGYAYVNAWALFSQNNFSSFLPKYFTMFLKKIVLNNNSIRTKWNWQKPNHGLHLLHLAITFSLINWKIISLFFLSLWARVSIRCIWERALYSLNKACHSNNHWAFMCKATVDHASAARITIVFIYIFHWTLEKFCLWIKLPLPG